MAFKNPIICKIHLLINILCTACTMKRFSFRSCAHFKVASRNPSFSSQSFTNPHGSRGFSLPFSQNHSKFFGSDETGFSILRLFRRPFLGVLMIKSVNFSNSSVFSRNWIPDFHDFRGKPWIRLSYARESTSPLRDKPEIDLKISERVSAIVDEISGLTLLEVADLTEVLRKKLDINEMPIMTVMMPGMGFSRGPAKGGSSKVEEKKAEKTAFDLKLESFDAASKIKIIKEVRTFTDLGLKEAKDLVEKTPTLLKKGVSKEEAEKIIEKMKSVGAKVVME